MSDLLKAAGSAAIQGGVPAALPRHIGGQKQDGGAEPQARADDVFERSDSTAGAQSALKLDQLAKNVGKAVVDAKENIGSALTKARKQGVYAATIISGALSNVPFPTAIEPFPAEDRETVKSLLQPGDIILQKNEGAIIMQAMSKVVTGSDFVHAALYEGDGKMLESVVRGVREASVDEYLQGDNSVQIVRPHYESEADLQAAIEFAKEQKGKPYNMLFDDRTKESYYCTQLVREAFQAMPHPIEVSVSDFMGKHIVGAGAFQKIPDAEVIYNHGGSFRDSVNGVSVGIHSSVVQAAFAGIPMFLSSAAIAPVLRSFS